MVDKKLERLLRITALYAKVVPDVVFSTSRGRSESFYPGRTVKMLFLFSALKLGYKPREIAQFRGITQIDIRAVKKSAYGLDGEDWHNAAKHILSIFQKKIVYLAGKVSDLNYEEVKDKFKRAESVLTDMGYYVVNPTKVLPPDVSWETAMRTLIPLLAYCDTICLLSDWEQSEGAKLEYEIAKRLGMEFFVFEEVLNRQMEG